jgi:hypothetical protein
MVAEDDPKEILASLEPLFKEAEEKKLWFHCNYQDMWFSPKELRAAHAEGRLIWGPVNWRLRDPYARLWQIADEVKKLTAEAFELGKRVG